MKAKFQAVLYVDYKKMIYPLTEKFSKKMLPVANKPLLNYALEYIEKSGFDGKEMIFIEFILDMCSKRCCF